MSNPIGYENATHMIEILLNGDLRQVPEGLNILGLLASLNIPADRVAVELNRGIVRQPDWEKHQIDAGAQVEIVQFVGGG